MCKINRMIWMVLGFVMMCLIFVLVGFAETGIPRIGYLGMWIVSAGAVCYGAGI